MKLNDKRVVFKRIAAVREILKNEISANARGGKYASGRQVKASPEAT
ncbi:hypothetical protein HED54_05705 [Ochrobactrum anthropi ATCC 49188]|nr:hypothetical protein [Brucella anthropi ATCC 49188]